MAKKKDATNKTNSEIGRFSVDPPKVEEPSDKEIIKGIVEATTEVAAASLLQLLKKKLRRI